MLTAAAALCVDSGGEVEWSCAKALQGLQPRRSAARAALLSAWCRACRCLQQRGGPHGRRPRKHGVVRRARLVLCWRDHLEGPELDGPRMLHCGHRNSASDFRGWEASCLPAGQRVLPMASLLTALSLTLLRPAPAHGREQMRPHIEPGIRCIRVQAMHWLCLRVLLQAQHVGRVQAQALQGSPKHGADAAAQPLEYNQRVLDCSATRCTGM